MGLTVGEIAEVLGLSVETIRYYGREGLIHPQKNPMNGYWEYSSDDVLRISDILFYRYMNMSISNIRKIMEGAPLEDIGDIMDDTEGELVQKIRELTLSLEELHLWRQDYKEELKNIGKFSIAQKPKVLRIGRYQEEGENIASYLKGNIRIDADDWCNVKLSFYTDLKNDPETMHHYIALNSSDKTEATNALLDVIEEPEEWCLKTEAYLSENLHEMIDPMLKYASENGIRLDDRIYGHERTNYYENGKRKWIYSLYAPIKK